CRSMRRTAFCSGARSPPRGSLRSYQFTTCTRASHIRFRTSIALMSGPATSIVSRPSHRLIFRFPDGSYCPSTENISLPELAWAPSTCSTTSIPGTFRTILPARDMGDFSILRGENTAANSFWSFRHETFFLTDRFALVSNLFDCCGGQFQSTSNGRGSRDPYGCPGPKTAILHRGLRGDAAVCPRKPETAA